MPQNTSKESMISGAQLPFRRHSSLSSFTDNLADSIQSELTAMSSAHHFQKKSADPYHSIGQTTYRDRTYLQSIAKQCLDAFSQKPGNYIVFFQLSPTSSPGVPLFSATNFQIHSQEANMEHDARENLMQKIRDTSTPKIILAVQEESFPKVSTSQAPKSSAQPSLDLPFLLHL